MFATDRVSIAFAAALLAGLTTFLGAWIALRFYKINTRFLSMALGFSAGVMIYISFMELLPESLGSLQAEFGKREGLIFLLLAFFGGVLITWLIDKMLPSFSDPHEVHLLKLHGKIKSVHPRVLQRLGLIMALAIALHNFPEGIVTFLAMTHEASLGLAIACAIAIHNIPEGIAVAVPIFQSTGSKTRAYLATFLAGIAEPIGALIAYLFVSQFADQMLLSSLLAGVAGVMVFISFDELLPTAQHCSEECGEHRLSIYGLFVGMLVMAASIVLVG